MRRISFISILLLMFICTFAQTGYKYKSYLIELVADSSVFLIQTTEHNAKTRSTQLEKLNTNNRNLQYSPDGNFIAFISTLNNGEGSQLFRLTSEDLELTKLTSSGCTHFSWSPGSKKIVYVHLHNTYINETTGSLWIMDADGHNKTPLIYNRNFKTVQ